MPQRRKNKKGGRTGRKNGGGKDREAENYSSASKPDNTNRVGDDLCDLLNDVAKEASSATPAYDTVYAKYKESTKRFKKALLGKMPSSRQVSAENSSANDLMDAADYVAESEMVVEKQLMADLKIAMMARKRATEFYGDSGDKGHNHFLLVLAYCWGKLRSKHDKTASTASKASRQERDESNEISRKEEKENSPLANRFSLLSTDPDDWEPEDTEEEEELFSQVPLSRPDAPDEFSPDCILNGDDRVDAILFLLTMDELMGDCADRFTDIKQTYQLCKRDNIHDAMPAELMEAAVFSNYSIQLVATLEQELAGAHPHLNTIYKVLVLVAMPHMIQLANLYVQQLSPRSKQFKKTDAIEFLGECLAQSFAGTSRHSTEVMKLLRSFANKWKMNYEHVEKLVNKLVLTRMVEVRSKEEDDQWKVNGSSVEESLRATFGGCPKEKHSLLPCQYIGKTRSITSTIRLLQHIGYQVDGLRKTGFCIESNAFQFDGESHWGPKWNDAAETIQGDMDHFLCHDVLQTLINHSNLFMPVHRTGRTIPYWRELLTIFSEIKSFSKNLSNPVSWSLAFAFHLLLTSVYEVQGDGDVESIGLEAKKALQKFVDHFDTTEERIKQNLCPQSYKKYASFRHLFEEYLRPFEGCCFPDKVVFNRQIQAAFWNPLSAGSVLLYMTQLGNVGLSHLFINPIHQLNGVMHLFNGFKERGILQEGKFEVLDFLHSKLLDAKGVWEGEVPRRGSFTKRFYLCLGLSPTADEAKQLRKNEELCAGDRIYLNRTVTPVSGRAFSKSYRHLILHEFLDPNKRLETAEERKLFHHDELFRHEVLSSQVEEALVADMQLLSTDLLKISEHVLDFFLALSKKDGIDAYLAKTDPTIGSTNRWRARVSIPTHSVLEILDQEDDPMAFDHVADTFNLMKEFFAGLGLDDFSLFSAKELIFLNDPRDECFASEVDSDTHTDDGADDEEIWSEANYKDIGVVLGPFAEFNEVLN